SNYVRMLNLRKALGDVRLVDARAGDPIVAEVVAKGYDLNEGMVLIDGERIYHGDACVNRLAMMSTASGVFNRLNAWVFRSETASRVLYPFLRAGRNVTLSLLGRKKIDFGAEEAPGTR
ncbi:MAG: DUF393 domain-containing protein, partial [Pseudomonadota bacterium]